MEKPNRSEFFIKGVISGVKVNPANDGRKAYVQIYLTEKRGRQDNPKYVNYSCRLVGNKVNDFITLFNNGNIPVGSNEAFTVLSSSEVEIDTQSIQAQRTDYEGGQNVVKGNPFNTNLTQWVLFDFSIDTFQKNNQQQHPQQNGYQQQPAQQPPQQPMQQNGYQQQPAQQPPQQPMQQNGYQQQPAQQPPQQPVQPSTNFDDFDDDIPF